MAGRNDRLPHPIREKTNQIQSELKHMMQKISHAISNRFFGNLFGGNDQNCGACCYSQGYNQGASNYNNQGFNHGSSNQAGRCQCDYSKTFTDQNGRTHGGCRRSAFIFTVKERRNFFKFPEPTSLVVPGATQLDGVTLAVEISSLPEGIWLFLLSTLTF